MLCDSRNWARPKRKTTVAPSSHSPIAMAPATATVIRTCMSNVRRRSALQARRTDGTPPETIVSSEATCASRVAPMRVGDQGDRQPRAAGRQHPMAPVAAAGAARLFVFEPGAHPGVGDRADDRAGRQPRRVVFHAQAARHHVGAEGLEACQVLEPALDERNFLVAVEALDLEDRLGVNLAHGAGGWGPAHVSAPGGCRPRSHGPAPGPAGPRCGRHRAGSGPCDPHVAIGPAARCGAAATGERPPTR